MANGRVITGYSMPKVAKYDETTNAYSDLMALARGVSVTVDAETADSNDFYADNVLAESATGTFSGGTVTLEVDGLKDDARTLIQGLATPTSITVGTDSVNVMMYDDEQKAPYCGVGFVIRYMEAGVTSYVPVVLPKVLFDVDAIEAATQEEEIDWQTTELTATIFRADDAKHTWRKIGAAQTTEAKAVAVVEKLLTSAQ